MASGLLISLTMDERPELERAARELELVLEANPREAKTYCLLGAIQDRLGKSSDCVASWTRAHDIAPDDLDILAGLGVALSRAARHSEAARAFGRVATGLLARKKRMQLSGELGRFQVPDLLDFLSNQRASGTLYVRSGSTSASLSIAEGRLVGVEAGVRQVIRTVMTWQEGQFVFEEGEPIDGATLDARAVLLDVIRELDEEHYTEPCSS
jgi:hypothetical protein